MVKWGKPVVLDASALEKGLGHCSTGTSAGATNCSYGDATNGMSHACQDGGSAGYDGGCSMGDQVWPPPPP